MNMPKGYGAFLAVMEVLIAFNHELRRRNIPPTHALPRLNPRGPQTESGILLEVLENDDIVLITEWGSVRILENTELTPTQKIQIRESVMHRLGANPHHTDDSSRAALYRLSQLEDGRPLPQYHKRYEKRNPSVLNEEWERLLTYYFLVGM